VLKRNLAFFRQIHESEAFKTSLRTAGRGAGIRPSTLARPMSAAPARGRGSRESGQHLNVTFLLLASGTVAFALMSSIVGPALPDIQEKLGTSVDSVTWVMTAYLLSASVATPLIGRLGDIYGKVRCFVAVLVLLAVGGVIAAVADSLAVMLLARVVTGVAGGVFPLAFGIARDEFPRERVAGVIGLLSAMAAVGGGAGVVLAGPIADNISLSAVFLLPMIPVVVAAVGIVIFVPESPVRAEGRVNWRAAVLMSLGLAGVLLAVSEAATWGWGSPKTLGLLAAGAGVLVLWVRTETHSSEPLVDMRMMRIKGVWTTNVVAFSLGVGLYTVFILVPEFVAASPRLGYGFGASVGEAGLFLLPSTVATVICSALTGRLERRFGSKPPMIAGVLLSTAAYFLFAFLHEQRWEIYLWGIVLGAGTGFAFAAIINLIIGNVAMTQTGVATGMNSVMRTAGGAFGGSLVASILGANVGLGGSPTERGFTLAFAACGVVIAAGAVVGLMVPEQRRAAAVGAGEAPGPPAAGRRPEPARSR